MKKSKIVNMETIAYYSGFSGLEVKYIEYGIDDYLYCVSGAARLSNYKGTKYRLMSVWEYKGDVKNETL